jgi:hypothetical protein
MKTYTKYPYRTEFPDSSERARNSQTLEDALQWARWVLHAVWRETNEYGSEGEPIYDAHIAIITNRNTGYRWILRREEWRVEFQTGEMLEQSVAQEGIDVHLTVEEAEALAQAASSGQSGDRRQKALTEQALDQLALLCRRVRERVRLGDQFIDRWSRSIPRTATSEPLGGEPSSREVQPKAPRPPYPPLGDPANLSLKEAGEILGKARNTLYLWYRNGKLPPAVDVAPFIPGTSKPVIVVPRYRLEAWQAGERMPEILQQVFQAHGLHEAPWVCWTVRKGASAKDVAFWVNRRGWRSAISNEGGRIYGEGLEEGRAYEVRPLISDG